MILVFCAFGAEFEPIRARLAMKAPLKHDGIRGCHGHIGNISLALVATGVGMRQAQHNAAHALDTLHDIDLVVITGVAGALTDDLPIGRVVLGDKLMTRQEENFRPDRILDVSRNWFEVFARALTAAGVEYASGPMMTSRRAIMTESDKHLAHVASGAITVDMESAVIGLEANNRQLPFVCMRTILDTAGQDLTGAVLADENGHVRLLAAAKTLIKNPTMIVGVARLIRNLRLATDSMAVALEAVLRRID